MVGGTGTGLEGGSLYVFVLLFCSRGSGAESRAGAEQSFRQEV